MGAPHLNDIEWQVEWQIIEQAEKKNEQTGGQSESIDWPNNLIEIIKDVVMNVPCKTPHSHRQVVERHFSSLNRKQVEQFSRNVAKKMLTFRSFRHIPDIAPRRISSEDPGSATIVIMPRRGEILDVTNHDGRSYQPSPCTPNRQTGRCNTINGGASISDHRRRRRGIAEGEERGEMKINLSIPNPNHQCTSCALLCLIAFQRGVWLRSCFAMHRLR